MAGLLRSAFRLRACLFRARVGRSFGTPVSPPAPAPASSSASSSSSRAPASRHGSTRHLFNQTRLFTIATQEKGDTREQAVPTSEVTKSRMFDWALNKLDTSIRRTGRITENLLLNIFSDICRSGNPSTNQALLLLRSCGMLLPELQPAQRTELAHTIWSKLKELGVTYDISHYNALLKIYLENEHEFSPTEFLTKMEEANVQPNRVTYQRLIAACCSKGDIAGASNILSFMKSKDLPITESVFSTLVTGHARAGDMQNAENILSVMKTTGINPGSDTYVALLKAYAEKGDIQKIEETLENLKEVDCYLTDKELMEIIFSLAKSGYPQYVQNILKKMKCDGFYIPDGMNISLHLITHGLDDTAFQVLKTFPQLSLDGSSIERGTFLLHHCVNVNMPTAKLKHICDKMKESSLHSEPLPFVLRCALQSNKAAQAIDLMKIMKEEGLPVKRHYFWPLLTLHLREKNLQGTVDVLKVMHEMQVVPDTPTYRNYVLPHFEDTASASRRLQEMGCPIEVKEFSVAQVMYEATDGSLENVVALLSSPNMPPMDLSDFRGSLILGFKKTENTDAWSKITELLYKDGRYCQTPPGPTEAVGYFLYHLIDNMSDSEVQAKEEQLRQYFHQLKEMGIKIHVNIFRGIQKLLNNCDVPELIKDIALLTSREDQEWNIHRQKMLEDLKAEGRSYDNILKGQIRALCLEEDVEKALELKAQYESGMDVGSYASLIYLCCRHNKAEEAMTLKEELSQKYPSAVLSTQKYLALVKVLANSERVDDAINILKEMKEKDVPFYNGIATSFFHILNGAALQGKLETVTRLHEAILSQDLLKNNVQLCNPLVTVHLAKDDIPEALEALLNCYKKHGILPRLHDVLCKLIEKEHTELLQKAVDFINQERGQMTMLYELFFAFMSTGKYKEAKKIIETNGLRARPARLQWFAEKCIANNHVEILENLVELTRNLFECDRDEMYYYLLKSCKENDDWQKADAVWTKMQDENVIPRERTLILLADILKSNNQEVPFDVPETWPHELTQMAPSSFTVEPESLQSEIFKMVRNRRGEEALGILLEAKKKNIVFHRDVYSRILTTLLSKGFLEEALEIKKIAETDIKGFVLNDAASSFLIITQVRRDYLKDALSTLKTIIENGGLPSELSVTRLVQALAQKGDVESIRAVEKMVENLHEAIKLSSMLFVGNTTLAHINNNNTDAALEYLESLLISGKLNSQTANITYVYRKLIENKLETPLEKLDAMAERLANQFGIYRPVTDLFLQYINGERMEDARRLLERCSAIREQKNILNTFLPRIANQEGQVHKIKALLDLVPELDKRVVSFYLLKCYEYNRDLASAKALYEKLKEENVQPEDLFLKSYATFLKKMGETVPFTEPPNTFKFYADQLRNKQHEDYSSDED